MKEILRENKEAVRDAGLALIDIGSQLAAGKIDDAIMRVIEKEADAVLIALRSATTGTMPRESSDIPEKKEA